MVISDEKLSVGTGAAVALTVPAGARSCWLQADGGNVRYRMTGDDPTTSTGMVLYDNAAPTPINVPDFDLNDLRFLSESGTVALEVTYFG